MFAWPDEYPLVTTRPLDWIQKSDFYQEITIFLNFRAHDLATWKSVQLPNLRNIDILRTQLTYNHPVGKNVKILEFNRLSSWKYTLHLARL